MKNAITERLDLFRKAKENGQVKAVKISGAGVASVDAKKLVKSRKISKVVGRINRAKLSKLELTTK